VLLGWLLAFVVSLFRLTLRRRFHQDPRDSLRQSYGAYILAFWHEDLIGCTLNGERGATAMVSASVDGDLLAPLLRLGGTTPVRGSSSKGGLDKGGGRAFVTMLRRLKRDNQSACFAVDGPRGPRRVVQKGVALMAQKSGKPIVPYRVIGSSEWVLSRTWDQMRIPRPFSRLDVYYGTPILPKEGETVAALCERVAAALGELA